MLLRAGSVDAVLPPKRFWRKQSRPRPRAARRQQISLILGTSATTAPPTIADLRGQLVRCERDRVERADLAVADPAQWHGARPSRWQDGTQLWAPAKDCADASSARAASVSITTLCWLIVPHSRPER